MCCARRTARGQYGQVGVEKTLISTSRASPASAVFVASLSDETKASLAALAGPVDIKVFSTPT